MAVVSVQDNLHEMYRIFSWWHVEVFFLCYPENRRRHFIHIISAGLHFPCKLSSVEIICMKCQTCFTGENKKRGHGFAICWVSPENDIGSTGQWIVDIIHSVGDMCRPRSDCAEMSVHLGLSCLKYHKVVSYFYSKGLIYIQPVPTKPDQLAQRDQDQRFSTPVWTTSNLWIAIIVLSNISPSPSRSSPSRPSPSRPTLFYYEMYTVV